MKRTGNSKVAVVGWGRGMGHTGHMFLAHAVIQQAKDMNADPYFFISKTIGKDDPIYPEEKVQIYKTVFPQYANIFEPQSNLNQALIDLAKLGYKGVVLVVGADQKQAFQYLEKPNKEGVPVYQSFGFDKLRVISRQETRSKYAQQEGPRATPMREILMNPNATEQDKFNVWRRDMPKVLSDEQVLDLMQKAEQRMKAIPSKAKKIKEFISKVRPLLKESTIQQKIKVLKLLKEFARGNGDDDGDDLEYQVYQCNPDNEFEWIGGPLYQNNDLGRAHDFAYKLHMKHPTKAFMIYQPSNEFSRGGYGLTGEEKLDEKLDKEGFHVSVEKGKFLPSKYGQNENSLYLHDLMNSSETSGGPMLVTIGDKRIATEIAAMYGGYVEQTGMGTYRIYKPRGTTQTTKTPELTDVVEGDVIPLDARRPTEMSAEFINWLRANYPNLPIKDLKDPQKRNALYREFQNSQQLDEKWTEKYKRSIDCSNPKGFSQRAHCQGRKKNEEVEQVEERKKKKRKKSRKSVYGPVGYGWYGMNPGYSSEAGSDGGGDGGGMEEAKVHFTDPNARVAVFYKSPKLAQQNKVLKLADGIPYKVLDRFIEMVSTKYQIRPEQIFWTDVTKKTLESQDYLDEK